MTFAELLRGARRPLLMGIVNVTPDSFHRRHPGAAEAIAHARQLVADSADIIDIGGESTRPGAAPVAEDEEIARVVPVLRGLRDAGVPISIDTSKPAVMRAALDAGAAIVNDVNALQAPGALDLVAERHAAAVLVHMKGEPATMNIAPRYDDVVAEVQDFLAARVDAAVAAGIPKARLAVDPGIGFGKAREHNLALLAAVPRLRTLGCAVLVGVSGKLADHGRLAVASGADILRVHDVAAQKRLCDECHKPGPPP
jgi:dihydropteroate synthase